MPITATEKYPYSPQSYYALNTDYISVDKLKEMNLLENIVDNEITSNKILLSENIQEIQNAENTKIISEKLDEINKYFIMSFISNFLFAVAMLINVNISESFNLGIYTILTVGIPAIYIFIFGRHSVKELKNEFKLYDKKDFLISAFTWCLMLISSVKAYQVGSVMIVAPLFALTSIINAVIEFIFNKNKNENLLQMTYYWECLIYYLTYPNPSATI